ncbi:hypothetical protein HDU76_007370 [Blyttiomyces sp. JEL0837]|nr:hypothetical protein HDU76_007370 [Blyttiomyces sp. JEL0837]
MTDDHDASREDEPLLQPHASPTLASYASTSSAPIQIHPIGDGTTTTATTSTPDPRDEKARLFNVIILGVAFVLIFMAFSVVQNMASTVLPKSLAFTCLGTLYVSFGIFNLIAAAPIVEKIGCRLGLFLASLTYTTLDIAYVIAIVNDGNLQLQVQVFQILTLLGACGPCLLIYIMLRPDPQKPDDPKADPVLDAAAEAEADALTRTHPILKTARMMGSRTMLCLAPLFYAVAVEQSFYSGSLLLFVKSDNENSDLTTKLLLLVSLGIAIASTSFVIGPITDRFGSRPLVLVEMVLHLSAMGCLLGVGFLDGGGAVNKKWVLFPVALVLGCCDAILMNQIYKLLALLFPDTRQGPTAFAAYRFHGSFATGCFYVVSKNLLDSEGIPRLDYWFPLVCGVLCLEVCGVFLATKGRKMGRAGRGRVGARSSSGGEEVVVV